MGDALTLGLTFFVAFGISKNCSTTLYQNEQYTIKEEYDCSSECKDRIEPLFYKTCFIDEQNNDNTIIDNSKYAFIVNTYKNRISSYKTLFENFDNNIDELLGMFYEDSKNTFFDLFLEYIFQIDDAFLSESFLSLILESNINIFDLSINNALVICTQSKSKSIVRKANSILKYYFKNGICNVR